MPRSCQRTLPQAGRGQVAGSPEAATQGLGTGTNEEWFRQCDSGAVDIAFSRAGVLGE